MPQILSQAIQEKLYRRVCAAIAVGYAPDFEQMCEQIDAWRKLGHSMDARIDAVIRDATSGLSLSGMEDRVRCDDLRSCAMAYRYQAPDQRHAWLIAHAASLAANGISTDEVRLFATTLSPTQSALDRPADRMPLARAA